MKAGGDGLDHKCPRCGWDHGGERSPRSQRFLHAIVASAYENWPSREPHPTSSSHLRAWLFVHPKVAFCGSVQADPTRPREIEEIERLARDLRETGARLFFDSTPEGDVVLRVPRTAALAAKGGPRKGEFYSLVSRVLAVIEEETGIRREDLRREGLAAVAPRPRLGKRKAA